MPPHRKRIKHYEGRGHVRELTFSCYKRLPLLSSDLSCKWLASSLGVAIQTNQAELIAFVFMPEHVHLLVRPASDLSIGRFLAGIKRPVSTQARTHLEQYNLAWLERLMVVERPGKTCFRFWQEGPGFDRNIFTADALEAAIDYIHLNPVKRGLCEKATEWKWTSARYYMEGLVDPDLPALVRPRAEWFVRSGVQQEM